MKHDNQLQHYQQYQPESAAQELEPQYEEFAEGDFYEVMPYAGAMPYRDDATYDDLDESADPSQDELERSARMMGIVTLIVLAVIVASLSYVAVQAYQAFRETAALI